jgi:hypothetical protein
MLDRVAKAREQSLDFVLCVYPLCMIRLSKIAAAAAKAAP